MALESIEPSNPTFDLRLSQTDQLEGGTGEEIDEQTEQTETNGWMTPPDLEDCDDATVIMMSMGFDAQELNTKLSSRDKTMQLAYLHAELDEQGHFDLHGIKTLQKDKGSSCACLVM